MTRPCRSKILSQSLSPLASLVVLVATCVVAAVLSSAREARDNPAAAAVTHRVGMKGTVLGWTSWYGSYGLGPLPFAWCVDHGTRAPDPELGYRPTPLLDVPPETRRAVSYAVTTYASTNDPLRSAALMLALHDLMGAVYPHGELDLEVMTTRDLAGFGGSESRLLQEARRILRDSLAVARRPWPAVLEIRAEPSAAGTQTTVTVRVLDGSRRPVAAVPVSIQSRGATPESLQVTTGETGEARARFTTRPGRNSFEAVVRTVSEEPEAYGPTVARAQRVVVPAPRVLRATTSFDAPPPPATLELTKVDSETGELLAGALFDLSGPGGRKLVVESGTEPTRIQGLEAGEWQLLETRPPLGYRHDPRPRRITIPPGGSHAIAVQNTPVADVRFTKKVDGPTNPRLVLLSEARIRVTADTPDGPTVGECATDEDGRCALPPGSLVSGRTYCWRETRSPIGLAPARGRCFTAPGPGEVMVIEVRQRSLHTPVVGRKLLAGSDTPLPGAIVDLYRLKDPDGRAEHDAPRIDPPGDARWPGIDEASGEVRRTDSSEEEPQATWVARATSAEDGTLDWGLQLPGFVYCAVEARAPDGALRDQRPRCARLLAGEELQLVVENEASPPSPTTTSTTTSNPPTTRPAPPVSTPTTTASPPATVSVAPPATDLPRRPSHVPAFLPETGFHAGDLTLLAVGLLTSGTGLVLSGRSRQVRRRR